MNIVYLNGKFMPENEAKISIFDRGFIFGDGIYEVLPVVNGQLADKDGFWERLERSTKEIQLTLPMGKDEYFAMLNSLIGKNSLNEGGVYTQITRGVAPRDFALTKGLTPTCMAFCYECKVIDNPLAKTGIEVASVEDIRWKRRDIKSISLLGQCLAKDAALEKGGYEGFMVEDGFVSEGVSSSAYIVKDSTIITTPPSNQILPGVRRKNLIKIAKDLGVKVEFRHFSIDEVMDADEAFISAATLVILPVVKIDGKPINGCKVGEITKKLREIYVDKIHKEVGLL